MPVPMLQLLGEGGGKGGGGYKNAGEGDTEGGEGGGKGAASSFPSPAKSARTVYLTDHLLLRHPLFFSPFCLRVVFIRGRSRGGCGSHIDHPSLQRNAFFPSQRSRFDWVIGYVPLPYCTFSLPPPSHLIPVKPALNSFSHFSFSLTNPIATTILHTTHWQPLSFPLLAIFQFSSMVLLSPNSQKISSFHFPMFLPGSLFFAKIRKGTRMPRFPFFFFSTLNGTLPLPLTHPSSCLFHFRNN
jgi:hypothetical protein